MTNASTLTQKAEVIKKGTTYYFMNNDECMARLGVITYTFKEKLRKDLAEMKYYLPKEDFKRSELPVPKSGDVKETDRFRSERDSLAMWGMAMAYIKSEDKKDIVNKICQEYFQMEVVPKVFLDKFTEILEDFNGILIEFKSNAEQN